MTDKIIFVGNVSCTNEYAEGIVFRAEVDKHLAAKIVKCALVVREMQARAVELWDSLEVFDRRWTVTKEETLSPNTDTTEWQIVVDELPEPIKSKLNRLKELMDAEADEKSKLDEEEQEDASFRTAEAKRLQNDPDLTPYLRRYELLYGQDAREMEDVRNSSEELEAIRTECDCITITDDDFYWSAYDKYGSGMYETDSIPIEAIESLLSEPLPACLRKKPIPTIAG